MEYIYKTKDTCSTKIKFDLQDNIITNVEFEGGCDGNLKAIPRLVEGLTVEQIMQKCSGITCGRRATSCADQLAVAVGKAFEENK